MATSQNGWTVNPSQITDLTVAGAHFGGVRSGDVFTVLQYVAVRYAAEVERLIDGQCGAYNPRKIEGSKTWSNHASATAIDCNWGRHPRGVRGTFSRSQLAKLRELLTYCEGVVRWGGDFTTTVDEMHFEIHGNAAAVKALADKIKGDDMAMTDAEMDKLAAKIAAAIMGSPVNVGGEKWRYDSAVGYQTRKAYEIDQNTEPAEPAA
jgi:D-alanyl-D-alanine carboxypeptidase-like protein